MKLSELLDMEKLRELCESYTMINGAVTAILELDGEVLIATGWKDVCTRFHRVNEITLCRCKESETVLANNLAKGETYNMYRCGNGLVDVAVPITIRGEHVANFFTGQFFTEAPDRDFFLSQAEKFGFDKDSYLDALSKIPVFSEDSIKSMMKFFTLLVEMIAEMGLARKELEEVNQELRNTENALRHSEEKFSKAFHATPSSIALTRASDGLVLEVNESLCRLTEYSREEVLGRSILEMDIWADPHVLARYRARAMHDGSVRGMEASFRTKSGRLLQGIVFGERLVLASEPCLMTVIRDVTEWKEADAELQKYRLHLEDLVSERTEELREANEKLLELDRLKSMFIATMSHELRTPLNAIIGFTSITLNGLTGELNNEQKDHLSRVFRAGKHLLALINDIIDISKIEAGKFDSHPEDVSLDDVIKEVIGVVKPQLEDKDLALAVDIPSGLRLNIDRRRLLQCILNFLSNAAKYTETGMITVAAREMDSDVAISVSDTGIGIAEKDMPKVFHAFERFGSKLSVKAGGTGLGLYLTRRIARDILHGDVTVQSREGEGSTFTITVPKDFQQEPSGA